MIGAKFILTIHMDSGDTFKIKCKQYSFNYDTAGGLSSYSIKGINGLKNNDPMAWLKLAAIERIEVRKTWW